MLTPLSRPLFAALEAYMAAARVEGRCAARRRCQRGTPWLRTNGVNTNSAAAKVLNSDRSGKKVRPGTPGEIKSRLTGVPKRSLCKKKHEICGDPISADPICPFRILFFFHLFILC